MPSLRSQFLEYPAVYRSKEGIKSVMPAGMLAMFMAMLVLAILYAMLYQPGSSLSEGARFGALIVVVAICAFVVHNYVNLNIVAALNFQQSITYFVEWLAVGTLPSGSSTRSSPAEFNRDTATTSRLPLPFSIFLSHRSQLFHT